MSAAAAVEVVAAGVLPCALSPQGRTMLLLGQEGSANGVWSDTSKWDAFGGRRDLCKDETPEDTAAREFYEESGGVVCDLQFMRQLLRQHRFLASYDTYARGSSTKVYRMYVVCIPFRDYPDLFSNVYHWLRHQKHERLLEKKQMRWFSLEQVQESLLLLCPPDAAPLKTHYSKKVLLRGHFALGLAAFLASNDLSALLKQAV